MYYAVANGKTIGIFTSWPECNESVKGYKNAIYKKFANKQEAEEFIQKNPIANNPNPNNTNVIFVPDYYVYTDGACSNNGKPNAKSGIGIFFGINDSRNVSKPVMGDKHTNNIAELTAIIETYTIIKNDIQNKKVAIMTDSEYAMKCATSYGEKCAKNNWSKPIPNLELVKQVYELYKNNQNIMFIHVDAHTNNTDIHSVGNHHADRLANQAIGLEMCPYQK